MAKKRYLDFKNITVGTEKHFAEINDEHKLQLRLSYFAWSVIEDDRQIYEKKRNSILNLIFYNMCNFFGDDNIFAYKTLKSQKEKLEKYMQKDTFELNKYLHELLDELNYKVAELVSAKGTRVSVALNKKNYDYLTKECSEAMVYGEFATGVFFRCVLERYALLPHIEREKIINSEKTKTIRSAISQNHILRIVTGKGTRSKEELFYAKPYKMMTDPLTTFSYLVCLSCKADDSQQNWKPASFRISRARNIEETETESCLETQDIKEIENKIKERSVSYLLSDITDIKVLLTANGMNMYNSVLQSRPLFTEKPLKDNSGRYLLKLNCSAKQARDYFFGFGKEAEIIAPEALRQQFITGYKSASDLYSENE